MTIGRIKQNDVIRCDVRGQHFWALAAADGTSKLLAISPLTGCGGFVPTQRTVTARQVIGHWRTRKGSVV